MSAAGGVYVCRKGYQPTCTGVDENGQLVWTHKMKEPWHLKMFPVKYGGDFATQWMWKSLQEKGVEWESTEAVESSFAQASKKLLRRIKR